MNPVGSEFSATFVGRLVTTLIQQMGNRLGDQLDMLLKAVLSKLQGAQTLTVAQSLIMVYAHLVHSQLEAVLAFLSSVPGPTGASALQFVLGEWVGKQQQFFGCYESKVSSLFSIYSSSSSACTLHVFIKSTFLQFMSGLNDLLYMATCAELFHSLLLSQHRMSSRTHARCRSRQWPSCFSTG